LRSLSTESHSVCVHCGLVSDSLHKFEELDATSKIAPDS
jgi:hypothetical protein